MTELKINADVLAELKRIAAVKRWDVETWTPTDNAIVIVRAMLTITGEKELLNDTALPGEAKDATAARVAANRAERTALVNAILPILTAGASINFRRGAMVELGLAPAMAEKSKVAVNAMV